MVTKDKDGYGEQWKSSLSDFSRLPIPITLAAWMVWNNRHNTVMHIPPAGLVVVWLQTATRDNRLTHQSWWTWRDSENYLHNVKGGLVWALKPLLYLYGCQCSNYVWVKSELLTEVNNKTAPWPWSGISNRNFIWKIWTPCYVWFKHLRSAYIKDTRAIRGIINFNISGAYRDAFHWHGLTLIAARISNHVASKLRDECTFLFANFNGAREWISNFIPRFILGQLRLHMWQQRLSDLSPNTDESTASLY